MYVLGIDFGTKKLGLAILETDSEIASPLPIIPNNVNVFAKLADYLKEYHVTTVVFGLPTYESTQKKVKAFAQELKDRHPNLTLTVDFTEESNTSLGIKKDLTSKKQKENLDSFSAVAIVKQWCSEH